jgi:hypothetical protein
MSDALLQNPCEHCCGCVALVGHARDANARSPTERGRTAGLRVSPEPRNRASLPAGYGQERTPATQRSHTPTRS